MNGALLTRSNVYKTDAHARLLSQIRLRCHHSESAQALNKKRAYFYNSSYLAKVTLTEGGAEFELAPGKFPLGIEWQLVLRHCGKSGVL